MFKSVGELVREIPGRPRASNAIVALQIRQMALDSIKKTMKDLPEEVLDQIKVTTYKNGVLTIIAPTILLSELKMRSGGLVDDVNKVLGKKLIRDLRFRAK